MINIYNDEKMEKKGMFLIVNFCEISIISAYAFHLIIFAPSKTKIPKIFPNLWLQWN